MFFSYCSWGPNLAGNLIIACIRSVRSLYNTQWKCRTFRRMYNTQWKFKIFRCKIKLKYCLNFLQIVRTNTSVELCLLLRSWPICQSFGDFLVHVLGVWIIISLLELCTLNVFPIYLYLKVFIYCKYFPFLFVYRIVMQLTLAFHVRLFVVYIETYNWCLSHTHKSRENAVIDHSDRSCNERSVTYDGSVTF